MSSANLTSASPCKPMEPPPPPPPPQPPESTPPPPPPPATPTTATDVKHETPESTTTTLLPTPPSPAAIIIPSHSRWFSWSSIHDTERRLLPEFFDGNAPSRTPSVYKYLRDSIIRKCWESPTRRVTFTDARRGLVADVGSVRRVFEFLEAWGLVNYTPPVVKQIKGVEEKKVGSGEEVEKKEAVSKRICTGCGAVCSQACFAPEKQAELILCARCFVRGNYRAGLTSGDFKRVDIGEGGAAQMKSEWTDKETLHLLEAVLHYGDDWQKVVEHMGNGRSQKDCVARFIKLPFGEQFMGSLGGGQMSGDCWKDSMGDSEIEGDNVEESHMAKKMRLTPLADTSNPIMAQVAFLSAIVGSEVAEAAAWAAVKALSEVDTASPNDMNESFAKMEGEVALENGHTIGKTIEAAAMEARFQLKKDHEDLEQSISEILKIQMKEIQDKIVRFEEMELLMEKEWSQLQHMENLLFADQLSLLQQKVKHRSLEGVGEIMRTASEGL